MKRFIRYLYEYEQGMRSRNVGFVKVEQDDMEGIIHIHGKGMRVSGGDSLSVYLFYEENKRFIKILQGQIGSDGPAINYRLRYTPEDVGTEENYKKIDGVLLENLQGRRFAAVWDAERPVDVENMVIWQEQMQPEMLPEEKRQSGEQMPEEPQPEEQLSEEGRMPGEEPPQSQQSQESQPEGQSPEERMSEERQQSEMLLGEPIPPRAEGLEIESSEEAGGPRQRCKVTKIQRREISMLPRCEWRLANNNFLLHGYYNYRHLALIDDGNILKLGVPGIYHEKEEKAAEAFGFPEFIDREETGLTLCAEECNERERFGYWCRQVRRPVM